MITADTISYNHTTYDEETLPSSTTFSLVDQQRERKKRKETKWDKEKKKEKKRVEKRRQIIKQAKKKKLTTLDEMRVSKIMMTMKMRIVAGKWPKQMSFLFFSSLLFPSLPVRHSKVMCWPRLKTVCMCVWCVCVWTHWNGMKILTCSYAS